MVVDQHAGWNPAEDAWLAGFTDGEGSFNIRFKRGRPTQGIIGCDVHFGIWLRADDVAILRALQGALGGRVTFAPTGREGREAPRYAWQVWAKADLLRLMAYFDRFPLRAKKARDYAIWRRAVLIYCDGRPIRAKAPEMFALREALIAGRRYEQAESDLAAAERAVEEATEGVEALW